MAEVMIAVKDLWKAYGKLQVLKGLDLEVHKGETVVILGRSGVGKSVLLRQIIGLERPEKGVIEIEEQKIWDLSKKKRQALIADMGMLFQGGALFDSMTVGQNTAFYLTEHMRQMGQKEIQKRVEEALEIADLAGAAEKMPADLSGGMRKRAALARVIAYRPKIVLYDEPTTGLDPITAHHINEMIIRTKEELQATSIVVTHDIGSAMMVGDRLAFHDDGKLIRIAPKKNFWDTDQTQMLEFYKNSLIAHNNAGER